MPSFKPKANKRINVKTNSNITLDGKHNEKMKEFDNIKNNILPKLKNEKRELKNKLKEPYLKIEQQLEIKDKLLKIKDEINKHKNKQKNYLLNNSKYIFDYFEKKKLVSQGENVKKTVLNEFFSKNKKQKENEEINDVQQYLINVDESFLNINNFITTYDVCEKCGGELVAVEHDGVLLCKKCGKQISVLIENEKPSYKEPPKEVCFYAYKRINHFREILAQFQAKETTQIPDEVIENIKNQIKKERITLKHMTNKKAKDILKKLGYNKYYEHIPFIKDKLGIRPPIMSPELEDTLCNLFMEIQKPYAKHCPDDRVNFLNYYYVLYKMCELLDERTFLPFFPMLKDPVKRIEQDEIWKKICKELQWEFVPTI
jgi:hypothetical protein|uniref:Viral late gene transcription factor 3 zinc ribbon domain-containing protein n=1 Tax=viral metagenome TaxID=1070528 RepID=A0A6C0CQ32_9ZZZZ